MGDSLEATILTHLRASPGRRFTRSDLVYLMKTCGFFREVSDLQADRKVREAIESLRSNHPDGGHIVSLSRFSGYWWSENEKEIEAAQAEDLSRMQATSAKVENRRRLLAQLQAQEVGQGRLL